MFYVYEYDIKISFSRKTRVNNTPEYQKKGY